jgi:hypothetical protein
MSESEEQSFYISPRGLKRYDSLDRFEKGLDTGRSRKEELWNHPNNQPVSVRSLGHLSPQQFKERFSPTSFAESWDDLTSDEATPHLEKNVDYKMADLESSIKEHGMVRPVIVGHPRFVSGNPEGKTEEEITGYTIPGEVLDGHHRAIAAMRAGVRIPTNILDRKHQPQDGRGYRF